MNLPSLEAWPQRKAKGNASMASHIARNSHKPDRIGLTQAKDHFKPIEQFLNQLRQEISDSHDSTSLDRRESLHKIAKDTYEVRYSLHGKGDERLSLTFTLVGEEGDKIIFQGHQRSTPRDVSANPGQVDQHVYRLEEMANLMQAVQEKVTAHLAL